MGVCDFCNKETDLLFKCIHCGAFFCKKHRLPEDHACLVEVSSSKHIIRDDESSDLYKNDEKSIKNQDQKINNPLRVPFTVPILLLFILSIVSLYSISIIAYDRGYNPDKVTERAEKQITSNIMQQLRERING